MPPSQLSHSLFGGQTKVMMITNGNAVLPFFMLLRLMLMLTGHYNSHWQTDRQAVSGQSVRQSVWMSVCRCQQRTKQLKWTRTNKNLLLPLVCKKTEKTAVAAVVSLFAIESPQEKSEKRLKQKKNNSDKNWEWLLQQTKNNVQTRQVCVLLLNNWPHFGEWKNKCKAKVMLLQLLLLLLVIWIWITARNNGD